MSLQITDQVLTSSLRENNAGWMISRQAINNVFNQNDYNLLKCGWCINCRILLYLICNVVIGGAIGQLHEPIRHFRPSPLNPPITTLITITVVISSGDRLSKVVKYWYLEMTIKSTSPNEIFTFVGNFSCYD